MKYLSPILKIAENNILIFFCPGCKCQHKVVVGTEGLPRWTWNNDVLKPTFSPSLHIWHTRPTAEGQELIEQVKRKKEDPTYVIPYTTETLCHSYIRDGKIEFLPDCKHDLKGQTVDLPEFT